jgi:hypothetical protein
MARQHAGGYSFGAARLTVSFALLLAAVSCSGGSSPSTPTPTPTPTPTTSLTGTVTDAVSNAPVSGAKVAVQGQSATTGADGKYTITGLTNGATTVTSQHQGHLNFSQSVTLSGATTTNIAMTPSNVAKGAGNWSGTWRNTAFASTGTITMVVSADTVAQTVTVVLDVNGNVFGGADPPSETLNGTYSPTTGGSFSGRSAVFGNVTMTVSPSGQISGSATQVPPSFVSRLDFTGTATTSQINISYTVTFTAGGTANGTAVLNKS